MPKISSAQARTESATDRRASNVVDINEHRGGYINPKATARRQPIKNVRDSF
jgi:hypothetical protein